VLRLAAKQYSMRYPAQAAALLHRAAEHLEACGEHTQAESCRVQAGRMGPHPYIQLEAFNIPDCEAGQAMTTALKVHNNGRGPAQQLRFYLGETWLIWSPGSEPNPWRPERWKF